MVFYLTNYNGAHRKSILGIGTSSGSGGNSNGVFAFGNNVGGGSGRKIPPFNITPSPMKSNNRQVNTNWIYFYDDADNY